MLERRLQNRVCQRQLATRPDGTVHDGPDRATGAPGVVHDNQRDVSKSWRNSHGPDNREAQFLCV